MLEAQMIPITLNEWNLDAVFRLASRGVFESDRFDFKEALPRPNDENGKRRLRRTIAAFANALGGFLVIGVRDDRALPTEERVVGVESALDLPEHFGAHAAQINPTVNWAHRNPALALAGGRLVHVVEIAESRRRPHGLLEDDRWSFPKRTNRGTESMTLEEIRAAFVDDDRRRREIALMKSEVSRIRDLAERLNVLVNHGGDRLQLLARYEAELLRGLLPTAFGEIGHDATLVRLLNQLIERCMMADDAIRAIAAFELLPKDRSYSGTSSTRSATDIARQMAPQIVINAGQLLDQFTRIGL